MTAHHHGKSEPSQLITANHSLKRNKQRPHRPVHIDDQHSERTLLRAMSTSFKRVVSHPDELGNIAKKVTMKEVAAKELASTNESTASPNDPPAVVEVDDVVVKTEAEFGHRLRSSSSSGSSLSDRSETQLEELFQEEMILLQDEVAGLRRNDAPLSAAVHLTRVESARSVDSARGSGSVSWGWFQDVHGSEGNKNNSFKRKTHKHHEPDGPSQMVDISHPNDNEAAAAVQAANAPTYVLEESLSSQMLWQNTAGNRPPQPDEERAYYEMLWRQNFALSSVNYQVPKEVLIAGTPVCFSAFADPHFAGDSRELSSYGNLATDSIATGAEVAEAIERLHGNTREGGPQRIPHEVVNKQVKGSTSKEDLTVLIRGDNVFGTTVSKSFDRTNGLGNREVDTVNISIASYRVVESKKDGKYAQFLVIYREGSIRDTIGVWKRYSDFEALSDKVTQSHDNCSSVLANMSPLTVTQEHDVEHLPNAITSWHLLKKRKRWYRCLDAGYLSLKVFLLERFLHDILFESSSPNLLRDFVIYDTSK